MLFHFQNLYFKLCNGEYFAFQLTLQFYFRGNEFKEDDAIWKNGEDGGAGGGGPPPQGMGAMGPTGGYVAK